MHGNNAAKIIMIPETVPSVHDQHDEGERMGHWFWYYDIQPGTPKSYSTQSSTRNLTSRQGGFTGNIRQYKCKFKVLLKLPGLVVKATCG